MSNPDPKEETKPAPQWRRAAKLLLGLAIGAGLGYTYYVLVGCSSGGCPITSDPLVTTAYGAVVGGFVTGL